MKHKNCKNCDLPIIGRLDKKFCDSHCKSAYHYIERQRTHALFINVDRQLKVNRKILKKYNAKGKTVIRKSSLIDKGFNPKFFTHYWKSSKGNLYLFCYEFGFQAIQQKKVDKYLLIQWQDYMR